MWPDCLHHSLPHYLIRDTTFRAKKMQWTGNLFWFSLQLLSETFFYSKKNFARQYHTRTRIFIWNTHYSLQTLMKPDFSRQVFEKYSGIKFHENPSSGSRDVRYGHTHTHTHTHTDMTTLSVACSNFANAPKNWSFIGTLFCAHIRDNTILKNWTFISSLQHTQMW